MKVILLENIKGVGIKGDEKDVSIGHANNFLIPKKLALPLTKQLRTKIDAEKALKVARVQKVQYKQEKIVNSFKGKNFSIQAKANDQGTLFKAVSTDDIKKCILNKGISLPDTARVVITKPIKTKGEHTLEIKFSGDVTISIQVTIT